MKQFAELTAVVITFSCTIGPNSKSLLPSVLLYKLKRRRGAHDGGCKQQEGCWARDATGKLIFVENHLTITKTLRSSPKTQFTNHH